MIKIHLSCVMILVFSLIGLSSVVVNQAFAQAWILQECGSKYQELKAAGGLARKNWQDFLKDCSTQLRLHSKYIIPEDIKKGAPKHQHDPENKVGEARNTVEPLQDYMSRDNWTAERWVKARRGRIGTRTPSSKATAITPRVSMGPTTPTYNIPSEQYFRGNLGDEDFAL